MNSFPQNSFPQNLLNSLPQEVSMKIESYAQPIHPCKESLQFCKECWEGCVENEDWNEDLSFVDFVFGAGNNFDAWTDTKNWSDNEYVVLPSCYNGAYGNLPKVTDRHGFMLKVGNTVCDITTDLTFKIASIKRYKVEETDLAIFVLFDECGMEYDASLVMIVDEEQDERAVYCENNGNYY